MMECLLRIDNLSRGNCDLGPLGAEIDPGQPLTNRGKRNVEKTYLEHGQKRNGNELPVLNREPDKVGKVERKGHFSDREKRFQGHVLAIPPGLRFALDAVLGRAGEIRLMIENGFEYRPRIIEGEANAEGEQARQEQDFLHPSVRVQFPLRANIENRHGDVSGQEDRDIDQKHPNPTGLRTTA